LVHLIPQHTDYFILHGFFACGTEVDFDLIGGLADTLYKVGLVGRGSGGRFGFSIHNFLSGDKTP